MSSRPPMGFAGRCATSRMTGRSSRTSETHSPGKFAFPRTRAVPRQPASPAVKPGESLTFMAAPSLATSDSTVTVTWQLGSEQRPGAPRYLRGRGRSPQSAPNGTHNWHVPSRSRAAADTPLCSGLRLGASGGQWSQVQILSSRPIDEAPSHLISVAFTRPQSHPRPV
jgi:hypothetical protein